MQSKPTVDRGLFVDVEVVVVVNEVKAERVTKDYPADGNQAEADSGCWPALGWDRGRGCLRSGSRVSARGARASFIRARFGQR